MSYYKTFYNNYKFVTKHGFFEIMITYKNKDFGKIKYSFYNGYTSKNHATNGTVKKLSTGLISLEIISKYIDFIENQKHDKLKYIDFSGKKIKNIICFFSKEFLYFNDIKII